jgi:hypothetical protein
MCKVATDFVLVEVLIPADLSHTGRPFWAAKPVEEVEQNKAKAGAV